MRERVSARRTSEMAFDRREILFPCCFEDLHKLRTLRHRVHIASRAPLLTFEIRAQLNATLPLPNHLACAVRQNIRFRPTALVCLSDQFESKFRAAFAHFLFFAALASVPLQPR